MTLLESDIGAFIARLRERLDAGAKQYGNSSFSRPPGELLSEIQDELVDTAGWGLLLWARIARLRERVERLDAAGSNDG